MTCNELQMWARQLRAFAYDENGYRKTKGAIIVDTKLAAGLSDVILALFATLDSYEREFIRLRTALNALNPAMWEKLQEV